MAKSEPMGLDEEVDLEKISQVASIRKAIKEHDCAMCGRVIEKGERYVRIFSRYAGKSWTSKECAHCRKVCNAYSSFMVSNGNYLPRSLSYDDVEGWLDEDNPLYSHVFKNKWRIGDSLIPHPYPEQEFAV